MKYPAFASSFLGATGFSIAISGRKRNLLLESLDRIFAGSRQGQATIQLLGSTLRLNLANPSERMLNYASHNLLRYYRKSDLFLALSRVAGSGGLFVDIGANLGLYSFLARTLGLATILFEPEPIHSAFLQRNAVSVGQAFSCALSDERGKMKFFLCGEANPGSSSLVLEDNANSETHEAISVDVSTFDEMASRLQIDLPAVKLIKIDVEGNEEHTLRGMNGYLSTPDSAPIWCEVRGPNAGRSSNSVIPIVSYMERFGFRPFKCVNRSFSPFRLGIDPTPGIFDLLFAVPSRHKKLLCQ